MSDSKAFAGHGGPGEHGRIGKRSRCHGCGQWCTPTAPCYCCETPYIAGLTDQQIAELEDVQELTGIISHYSASIAVHAYRAGWRRP